MKGGAAFLLAVLLGVFLAAGQCGSGSADENGDDSHASSSSSDDHDDRSASDDDSDDGSDDEDKSDEDKSDEDKSGDDGHGDDGHEDGDPGYAESMKQHLESEGLHVREMSTASDDDCAAHAYGEVRNHFSDHPCDGLDRAWYELGDDGDGTAVLSVAWVRMPDPESASDLKRVVDRPGTGNITELSKQDGPYQHVGYSGWYYRSDVDGDTFRSVQAEPLADNDASRELARQASGATATD